MNTSVPFSGVDNMLLGNILLALAWSAFQGEFSLASLLTGYFLGYLVLLFLVKSGALASSRYVGKLHLAVALAGFFLWELVLANMRLALDVATPRFQMTPGILAIPLDATRDSEILLLAILINLTPGSVALDVSEDRKVMYVHAMYIDSPDATRADIKTGFERRVIQLLG
jgi:multicomponent Na+:H+ antiporter subunit E